MQSKRSSSKQLQHSLTFETIGTRWEIWATHPIESRVLQSIFNEVQQFDKKWSRFRSDSQVSQLSSHPGLLSLDSDEQAMWQLYERLYQITDGALNPLIGQRLVDAGYDADYTLVPRAQTTLIPSWTDALQHSGEKLQVLKPALIDIGAGGKGLLVDKLSRILRASCDNFTVDAGGDMYIYGHEESIGLEHPTDQQQVIGTLRLRDQAICGSAVNRRTWADMHHVFDARSGQPTHTVAATWASASSAMEADLMASALFFVEASRLASLLPLVAICMYSDGHVRYTRDERLTLYV